MDRLFKLLEKAQTGYATWKLVTGSAIVTAIGVWVASITAWLEAWGPIAWLAGGLTCALVFSILLLVAVTIAEKIWMVLFKNRYYPKPSDVNPMDIHFLKKRINLLSVFPPVPGPLEGKTFEECEIIGPINIFPIGTLISQCRYVSADYIMVTDDAANNSMIYNARIVKDCRFIKCKFHNVSFIVSEGAYPAFDSYGGCNWITITPPILAARTQPPGPIGIVGRTPP